MSFLIWILQINNNSFINAIKTTYIGNYEFQGNNEMGKYFYVVINRNRYNIETLRNHILYIHEVDLNEEDVMFVFEITDNTYERIVRPFIEGKYSEIARDYVKTWFSPVQPNGLPSTNWQILHKSPTLRAWQEERIGVTLPDDAEVWSRCKPEDEVYAFTPEVVLESI